MLGGKIRFEGLRGVGTVELDLMLNQRVYTLIGTNGVGKTKTLEALFQVLFLTNELVREKKTDNNPSVFDPDQLYFDEVFTNQQTHNKPEKSLLGTTQIRSIFPGIKTAEPVIFLGAQHRGLVVSEKYTPEYVGLLQQRRDSYFDLVLKSIGNSASFSSLNMAGNLDAWFTKVALSNNPYQTPEDNRGVEVKTVLSLMHQIDSRIDPDFLLFAGDGRVSLQVDGQKRELAQLSTGYASILKMLQAIVSGYGYFTNEQQLRQVRGIVLIDEIESHLHLSWQAGIIPLLKRLFPNTTFVITTHSPLVLAQLNTGEAYRLARDQDGVVRTHTINAPNKHVLADVLQEAFEVDINKVRQDSQSDEEKMAAKQALLKFLESEWGAGA